MLSLRGRYYVKVTSNYSKLEVCLEENKFEH